MRLLNLIATTHPTGNRIDLQWINPSPEHYPDVHILRSHNTHPTLVAGQLPAALTVGTVTTAIILTLDSQFITSLNRRFLSAALRAVFSQQQIVFSPASTVQVQIPGTRWQIVDVNQRYLLIKQADQLNVYLDQPSTFSDREALQGETVYYYTLIPANQNDYQWDWHNQVAAVATAPYQFDGRMYELLPTLYHRYDTVLAPTELAHSLTPTEQQWGQLRRFLAISGNQLDWLYSLATTLLDLVNLEQVDGRLLSLLADWIGWQTNYRQQLGIDHQRNEIRRAPYWYQTIGTLPTGNATLRRLFGWENRFWDNRIKELFHNVALSNRPEQLNFWALTRLTNTWLPLNRPLSLDFAYEGRAVAAAIPLEDDQQEWWLFYHTDKQDGWEIWYKTLSTLSLPLEPFTAQLDQALISIEFQNQLAERGWLLSDTAQIEIQTLENAWWINDPDTGEIYFIQNETVQLTLYHWTPSQPLSHTRRIDQHPTTGYCQERLWVWWESYDPLTQHWRIDYLNRADVEGNWSLRQTFTANPANKLDEPQRRQPWLAVTADKQSFWLFWLEKSSEKSSWQLQYQLVNPVESTVTPKPAGELFPDSGSLTDLFATLSDDGLWVFWAHRRPDSHFEIVYRILTADGWSERQTIVTPIPGYDAREPAVQVQANGEQLELFWSSNQSGSWSIWRGILTVATPTELSQVQMLTTNPYSQHQPLPLTLANGVTWLLYRANDSVIHYISNGEIIDFRTTGSTTLELDNLTKRDLWGEFGDFQTYTYDISQREQRTADNWYTRDTVAIYLTSDLQNPTLYQQDRLWLTSTLQQFLPIQVQVVFNLNPSQAHEEFVYTYDFPEQLPRKIEEFWDNQLDPTNQDNYLGLTDNYVDEAPDWIWLQALPGESLPPLQWRTTVDFDFNPDEPSERIHAARFRTCYLGLIAGGSQCGNN